MYLQNVVQENFFMKNHIQHIKRVGKDNRFIVLFHFKVENL